MSLSLLSCPIEIKYAYKIYYVYIQPIIVTSIVGYLAVHSPRVRARVSVCQLPFAKCVPKMGKRNEIFFRRFHRIITHQHTQKLFLFCLFIYRKQNVIFFSCFSSLECIFCTQITSYVQRINKTEKRKKKQRRKKTLYYYFLSNNAFFFI